MNIPSDVLSAVKAAPTLDLFPVTGTEPFSGQVLKTHQLQFDSGATLQLTRQPQQKKGKQEYDNFTLKNVRRKEVPSYSGICA
jgi:hypothetical protein